MFDIFPTVSLGCECHVITHFSCTDLFCFLCPSGCQCFLLIIYFMLWYWFYFLFFRMWVLYLIIHASCSDIFLCSSVGGCYQLITHVSCFYNLFCFLYTFQDVSVESWLLMFQVLIFVLHFVLFRRWRLQVNHLSSMFWHLFYFFILQDVSTWSNKLFLCFNIFSVYLVSKCS